MASQPAPAQLCGTLGPSFQSHPVIRDGAPVCQPCPTPRLLLAQVPPALPTAGGSSVLPGGRFPLLGILAMGSVSSSLPSSEGRCALPCELVSRSCFPPGSGRLEVDSLLLGRFLAPGSPFHSRVVHAQLGVTSFEWHPAPTMCEARMVSPACQPSSLGRGGSRAGGRDRGREEKTEAASLVQSSMEALKDRPVPVLSRLP